MRTIHNAATALAVDPNLDPQLLAPPPEYYLPAHYGDDHDHQLTIPDDPGDDGQLDPQQEEDMAGMDLTFILASNEPQQPDEQPAYDATPSINQVVHPNVDDAIVNFDAEVRLNNITPRSPAARTHFLFVVIFHSQSRSFPRRSKASSANTTPADPYATGFLREALGAHKWNIFSSRLFERRLGGPKARARGKAKRVGDEVDSKPHGASAIEFLIKVEVVKEVLRTFVPCVFSNIAKGPPLSCVSWLKRSLPPAISSAPLRTGIRIIL